MAKPNRRLKVVFPGKVLIKRLITILRGTPNDSKTILDSLSRCTWRSKKTIIGSFITAQLVNIHRTTIVQKNDGNQAMLLIRQSAEFMSLSNSSPYHKYRDIMSLDFAMCKSSFLLSELFGRLTTQVTYNTELKEG